MLSRTGLCDRPIARPEESYRVCLSVCVCVTHRDMTGFHVHTKHDDKYSFELCEFKSFAALACRDCGFESRGGMNVLSQVNVVYCQVDAAGTGRSFLQRSPAECLCVNECDQVQQ